MHKQTAFIFFCFITTMACSKNPTTPVTQADQRNFFPLASGNAWYFTGTSGSNTPDTNLFGTVAGTSTLMDSTLSWEVVTNLPTMPETCYFKSQDSKIYEYYKSGGVKRLFLDLPLSVGKRWLCSSDRFCSRVVKRTACAACGKFFRLL